MTALLSRLSIGKRSGATEIGETVTASATINTKGAWTQLLAATEFDAFLVHLKVTDVRVINVDTALLLDIGSDPAAGTSYGVIIPNVLMGHASVPNEAHQQFSIPVFIPAGSTVAARIQSIIVSETATVAIAIEGGVPSDDPFPRQGLVVDYGTNTGDSGGVQLPNASANVESAWVEITSATTHPHSGVILALQGNTSTTSTGSILLDVAIGAAGSEVSITEDVYFRTLSSERQGAKFPPSYVQAYPIDEGVRLAVRSMFSSEGNNGRYDVALYGWG